MQGGIEQGIYRLRPWVVGVEFNGRIYDQEIGRYTPRVQRDLDVGPK